MSARCCLAVALVTTVAGCGYGANRPIARSDAEGWVTARTEHFILHSDAGVGSMRVTAVRFEETYGALAAAIFGRPLDVPVEALVFYDDGDYSALNGDTAGRFIPGVGRTGSLLVARHSDDEQSLERVLAHELAHRFVRDSYPRTPNWLSEGIAVFAETVDVRPDQVVFGAAPRQSSHVIFRAGGVSFAELVGLHPNKLYGGEAPYYYSAAWALVHFLVTGDEGRLRSRFPLLLARVNAAGGTVAALKEAFAEIYPDKTEADFDAAMSRNTRRLTGPFPDTVASFPVAAQARPTLDGRPADADYLVELFEDLRQRRRRVDDGPPLTARPRFVRAEVAMANLERDYLGLALGYMWRPTIAAEIQVGAGPLGLETTLQARYLRRLGEGGGFYGSVGLGPVLALKSELLGNTRARERNVEIGARELFYYLGLEPDLSFEIRTPAGIVMRVGAAGYFKLSENQAELCAASAPQVRACQETRPRTGPQISRSRFALSGRFSAGWTW